MTATPIQVEAQLVSKYLAAQDDGAHEAFLDSRLLELHTALPGIIQSVDPATMTAVVQPAIMRVTKPGPVALPLCVDVPLFYLGGGPFVLSFPITSGDECLLIFAERTIDGWFQNGSIQPPTEYRFHDLSDGFAFVGFRSKARAVTVGSACELRANGALIMSIDASGNMDLAGNVTVHGSATVTGEVTGNGKHLSTHLHIAGTLASPSGAVTGSTGLPS